ncbi:hypothetical protein [Citrobacter portucalensis]|uniref:hypothetical protein n=1 Tax=Citrobacter portucalensis TaxID=1639133 RepID=UPI003C2B4756
MAKPDWGALQDQFLSDTGRRSCSKHYLVQLIFIIICWVLFSDPACYGAATSQILAIYENFLAFAVSVLLLANSLF